MHLQVALGRHDQIWWGSPGRVARAGRGYKPEAASVGVQNRLGPDVKETWEKRSGT